MFFYDGCSTSVPLPYRTHLAVCPAPPTTLATYIYRNVAPPGEDHLVRYHPQTRPDQTKTASDLILLRIPSHKTVSSQHLIKTHIIPLLDLILAHSPHIINILQDHQQLDQDSTTSTTTDSTSTLHNGIRPSSDVPSGPSRTPPLPAPVQCVVRTTRTTHLSEAIPKHKQRLLCFSTPG